MLNTFYDVSFFGNVENLNVPPQVIIAGKVLLLAGERSIYEAIGTDENGDDITLYWEIIEGGGSLLSETGSVVEFIAPEDENPVEVILGVTPSDGKESGQQALITIEVAARVPEQSGDVYNMLELNAMVYGGAQNSPLIAASVGALYKNRDAKIIIEIDDGETDPSVFSEVLFGLFTLAGKTPNFVKRLGLGVSIVDRKIEIKIARTDLIKSGKHYFELVVINGTQKQALSGSIIIIDSRL